MVNDLANDRGVIVAVVVVVVWLLGRRHFLVLTTSSSYRDIPQGASFGPVPNTSEEVRNSCQ